jgi:hypothetical protein
MKISFIKLFAMVLVVIEIKSAVWNASSLCGQYYNGYLRAQNSYNRTRGSRTTHFRRPYYGNMYRDMLETAREEMRYWQGLMTNNNCWSQYIQGRVI